MFDNKHLLKLAHMLHNRCNDALILRGSLSLNVRVAEKAAFDECRLTEDADFYLRESLSFHKFYKIVNEVVADAFGKTMFTEIRRTPTKRSSGSVDVFDGINRLFSFDVDLRVPGVTIQYNSELFSGELIELEALVADKVDAISTERVLVRLKDVYDLYLVSKYFEIEYDKVKNYYDGIPKNERKQQMRIEGALFSAFKEKYDELHELYLQQDEIIYKPEFEKVYLGARAILKPFLTVSDEIRDSHAIWSPKGQTWVIDFGFGNPLRQTKTEE